MWNVNVIAVLNANLFMGW